MVTLARRAQRIPFAPVVAALFGAVAAILVAAVPQWMFEAAVVASGLPSVLAAAAPPLGLLARVLAIALAFGAGSLLVWALVAPLTRYFEARARARTPWRDAGYDADVDAMRPDQIPPRRPIFAPDELGAPLMSDEAIAPAVPFLEPEPALATPLVGDELKPASIASAGVDSSIATLIQRLEDGLARRASNDTGPNGPGNRGASLPRGRTLPETMDISAKPSAATDATDETRGALKQIASR